MGSGRLIHLLSAERDLTAPAMAASGAELLALAAPQYQPFQEKPAAIEITPAVFRDAPSVAVSSRLCVSRPCPGSLAEMHTFLRIWNGRDWPATALSGSAATEGAR